MSNKIKLILLSFTALFFELSLIRWFPAHVFSIAFFSNVVLIGSFLGLGTGFLLVDHRSNIFKIFPATFLITIVSVVFLSNVNVAIPKNAQTWLWSFYSGNRLNRIISTEFSIAQILSIIFTINILAFIPLGQHIGRLMKGFSSLEAYMWNIIGSLFGVVGFGIVSATGMNSYIWFIIVGIVYLSVIYREKLMFLSLITIIIGISIIVNLEKDTLWSPYYSINTQSSANDKGFKVFVNQLFHQKAVDFDKEPNLFKKYSIPYTWFHPEKVLVIGAGNGNDVWVAQKSGAKQIDAIEIDPIILNLGKKHHPQHPYDNPNVNTYINDARSFMHNATDKYDMIVFGTLDSHANFSITSSMRLDNYIYTQQSLQEAKNLLTDKGVVVLLFSVPTQWILARLLSTAREVFGKDSSWYGLIDAHLFNLMIIAGPGTRNLSNSDASFSNTLKPIPLIENSIIPTDNWPYLYLQNKNIPNMYLVVISILIIISIFTVFALSPVKLKNIDFLFFFLGCGFLLLETKSVTTFSLLFGSTWLVNAVVFSSILVISTVSNFIVLKKDYKNPYILFSGLLVSLLFLYFFPVSYLLQLQGFVKMIFAGILVALPIYFSSMIFAIAFKNVKNVGIAMGSNLLGAVVGGFCEYSSMILGLNALYIIALLFYVVALLFYKKLNTISRIK